MAYYAQPVYGAPVYGAPVYGAPVYGANPYAPTMVAGSAAQALALDAADGRIDGRSFGANIAAPVYPATYGKWKRRRFWAAVLLFFFLFR